MIIRLRKKNQLSTYRFLGEVKLCYVRVEGPNFSKYTGALVTLVQNFSRHWQHMSTSNVRTKIT
jgi:hypothetical protein